MKEYRQKKIPNNNSQKPKSNKLDKKKLIIPIVSVVAIGALVMTISAKSKDGLMTNTISNTITNTILKPNKPKEPEKPEKTEEQVMKEKLSGYGIGVNGIDSAFDAKLVREKLRSYNYYNYEEKIVFLTFDDGTSVSNTPEILNTLEKENVKATFFLNGRAVENAGDKAKEIIKQTYNEGHSIANHSYSHDYKSLYPNRTLNIDAFKEDFNKTDEILKNILGKEFKTRVMRCPGGEMSWKGMSALESEYDKVSIDWNALTKDAEGKKKTADELVQEAINSSKDMSMVVLLMHDTKTETAKALPQIIKYYKDNGYTFKTLV